MRFRPDRQPLRSQETATQPTVAAARSLRGHLRQSTSTPFRARLSLAAAIALAFLCGPLAAQKTVPPATQQEESRMFGRVIGAIEDEGGGSLREALSKFASIQRDLEKRQYTMHTQWMAHYEYGKTLLAAKNPRDAVRLLETAQKDADSLTAKERQQAADALQEARGKAQ